MGSKRTRKSRSQLFFVAQISTCSALLSTSWEVDSHLLALPFFELLLSGGHFWLCQVGVATAAKNKIPCARAA